jgi:hypothetical protein
MLEYSSCVASSRNIQYIIGILNNQKGYVKDRAENDPAFEPFIHL